MIEGKVLFLTDPEDLSEGKGIQAASAMQIANADVVLVVDSQNNTKVVKNRYGRVGSVHRSPHPDPPIPTMPAGTQEMRLASEEEHSKACIQQATAGPNASALIVHEKNGIELRMGGKEVLRVSHEGCWIEGRHVPVDDDHDRAVYRLMKQWLAFNTPPSRKSDD